MTKVTTITVNTDASFHPEFKVGGYAFYIVCDKFKIKMSGGFKTEPKTSDQAEIFCIGNAISCLLNKKDLPEAKWLIINTDSLHGINMITKQENDSGKSVFKMWQFLIRKLKSKKNEFRHVRAHSQVGDKRSKANEWCDAQAKKELGKAIRAIESKKKLAV